MEAIGVVASIAGVIQLAVYGVSAIKFLRGLYKDCDDEVAQEFLRGLVASTHLLHDVQTVCDRIQKHKNHKVSQIRTTSLEIQLQDCVNDLDAWKSRANRLDSGDQKRDAAKWASKFANAAKERLSPNQRFQRFSRAVFRAKTATETAEIIQARFHQHQACIRTSLGILQADFQFIHIETLEDVNGRFEDLARHTRSQEAMQRQHHLDSRDSNSSIIAWSKSHDDRLRGLQSVSDQLSEKVDLLLQALSSHGSQSSSAMSEGDSHERSASILPSDNINEPNVEEAPVSGPILPVLTGDAEQQTGEIIDDGDLTNLMRLLEEFHSFAGQYFDDVVTEYVIAAEEWRASANRERLLSLFDKDHTAHQSILTDNPHSITTKSAARLLALRRRAMAESLNESLIEADKLLGLTQSHIAEWEILSAQHAEERTERLLVLPDKNPAVSNTELLSRMNEWLLEVMFSSPYLAQWHRLMTSYLFHQNRVPFHARRAYMASVSFGNIILLDRDEWERLLFKFWLLDGARSKGFGDHHAATIFTDIRESEMTMLAYFGEDEQDVENADEDVPGESVMLKQPIWGRDLVKGIKEVNSPVELSLPPSSATPKSILSSTEASRRYAEEPVIRFDPSGRPFYIYWCKLDAVRI